MYNLHSYEEGDSFRRGWGGCTVQDLVCLGMDIQSGPYPTHLPHGKDIFTQVLSIFWVCAQNNSVDTTETICSCCHTKWSGENAVVIEKV